MGPWMHSRRRPVITSGQSCARMKGSTSDRFMVRRWGTARCAGCRSQRAASSETQRPAMRAEKWWQQVIETALAGEVRLGLPASVLACWLPSHAPSLCRLCEDETTLLRHASHHPHHHHPIVPGRPAISERVFHLDGPDCAPPSALILRARSPLPGATTRGPVQPFSRPCYSSPASLPAPAAHHLHSSSRAHRQHPLPRQTSARPNSLSEVPEGLPPRRSSVTA